MRNYENMPSMEGRPVIQCSGCGCIQFKPANEHCCKCKIGFGSEKKPVFKREVKVVNRGSVIPTIDFGAALRFWRSEVYGWDQKELADRMATVRQQVTRIETNRAKPNLVTVLVAAKALDISPRVLMLTAQGFAS